MHQLLLTLVFALTFTGLSAQATFVKKQFCKKKSVEIIAGDQVPEGYVIVGTGGVACEAGITSLDELSDKHRKRMRSYGRMFKSCKVIVDFKGEIVNLQDQHGQPVSNREISFYALQPAYKMCN